MGKEFGSLAFSEGLTCLRNNRLVEASSAFERAVKEDGANVRYVSYYGLIVALLEKDIPRAISLCRSAINSAPYHPELYFNLCRVYHETGQRVNAIKTLREGLSFEKDSLLLNMALRRMGVRRPPPIRFLRRENLLNRVLGKLTYKFRKSVLGKDDKNPASPPRDPTWIRHSAV